MASRGRRGGASASSSSRGGNGDNGNGSRRDNVRASKALSLILRHKATDMGLTMRPDGYVKLTELLALPRMKPFALSYDDIKSLVDNSDKQRFQLQVEDGVVLIRAAQGHSVRVVETEQLLTPVTDASQGGAAVHGSYMNVWPLIQSGGLSRMARRHVHLATAPAGSAETISGMRRDCDLLIHVDVSRAMAAGIQFWLSSNRVLLTEGDANGCIPAQFFARAERLSGGRVVEVLSINTPSATSTPSPASSSSVASSATATASAPTPAKRRPPGFEEKTTVPSPSPPTPNTSNVTPAAATAQTTSASATTPSKNASVAAKKPSSGSAKKPSKSTKADKARSAAAVIDDDDNDTVAPSPVVAPVAPAKQAQVAPTPTPVVQSVATVPFLSSSLPASFTDKKWPMFFDKETAVTSAVAIVLPQEFWPQCQAIRSRHDKSFRRWPPHINLLYPFINAKHFTPYQLMEKLKAAVTDVPSFTIRLSRLDLFVHPKSCTLIAEPDATPGTALSELQKRIETIFPHCGEQSERGEHGYHAHCSLGQTTTKQSARDLINEYSDTWQPIEFTVDRLIVLTRTPKWSGDTSEDGPEHSFHTTYTIPLGDMLPLMAHRPPVPYVATAPPRVTKSVATASSTSNGEEKVTKIAPIKTRRGDDSAPAWIPFPTYRFDTTSNTWNAIPAADEKKPLANVNATTMTAVTYNVLFDKFDTHLIHTAERLPVLFDVIHRSNADIIGLQEVTPSFVRELLSQKWVRDTYYVSDTDAASTGGITVNPDGQLLLCRYPFTTRIHAYSKQKRVIVGELRVNHRRVMVPVVHLTSDHQDDSMQKRIRQMDILYDHILPLSPSGLPIDTNRDVLIMGDFNFGDGEDGEEHALRNDFKDAWRVVHGNNDDGFTFDPATNPLAKINTQTGISRRLDRVLVNSDGWHASRIERIGTSPWDIMVDKKPVTLMPSDHYGVRCELTYTPPSSSSSSDGKSSDSSNSASTTPFEMLLPDTDFDKLLADIGSVETKSGDLARTAAIAKLESCLPPIFVDKAPVSDTPKPAENKDGTSLFKVYVIGSVAMGIHSPSSDIDAVCVGALDRADFFKYAQRVISSTPISGVKLKQVLVDDVLVPVVKVVVDGIHIDLQYCRLANRPTFDRWFDLSTVPEKDLRKLDVQSTITLNGYRDAQLLGAILGPITGALRKKWITLFHIVKHWAKRRGLYSNRLGYLGGYGWSLLAARVCQLYSKAPVRELVCRFFDTYAQWAWSLQPVALSDPITGRLLPYTLTPRDVMAVVTLTAPYRNSARNVTPSTRNIMIEEFTRASRARTWTQLFEPSDFFMRHRGYLQLQVGSVTPRDFIAWCGWIESRVVSLLTRIEKQAPRVLIQPWSEQMACTTSGFPIACTYYIGLSIIGDTASSSASSSSSSSTKSPRGSEGKKPEVGTDFGSAVIDFQQSVNEWKGKTSHMDLQVRQVKRDRVTTIPIIFVMPHDDEESTNGGDTNTTTSTTDTTPAAATAAVSATAPSSSSSSKESKKANERAKSPAASSSKGKKESGKKGGRGGATSADESSASKITIQTSEAVYNRVRWDPSLNASEWSIGYEDRFKGMMEMAFNDFRTNDDEWIPWHRVWYFKQKGTIMWDREQRIDLLAAKK